MKAAWFVAVVGLGCADAFDIDKVTSDAREVDATITGECPEAFAGATHLFVDQFTNWPAAEANCIALDLVTTDSWHTHLTVINSSTELTQLPVRAGANVWLGLTDYESGTGTSELANFRWITLEEPTVTAWSPLAPETTTGTPYCGFRSPGDRLIHDASCYTRVHAFVCECDLYPVQSAHVPP